MTRATTRRWRTALAPGAAVAAAVGASACSATFGMPRGSTVQGQDTLNLWRVFVVAAIVVAGIVYALIGWSILRFRRRRSEGADALGSQFRANIRIEVIYTALPVVLAAALFVLTLRTEARVDDLSPRPDLVLDVTAFNWGWRFSYAGEGVTLLSEPSGPDVRGPELVLPLGRTVRVNLTSNDVIHAFWVREFLFKRDAIPGRTNRFDLTPSRLGTFYGECGEFCGLHHAYMTFSVRVVTPSSFDAWLRQRAVEAAV
jgi:cytochrome c oxidase subunit II